MSDCTCSCHEPTNSDAADDIDMFLDDAVVSHVSGVVKLKDLYRQYVDWCDDEDTDVVGYHEAHKLFQLLLRPSVRRGQGNVFVGYRLSETR